MRRHQHQSLFFNCSAKKTLRLHGRWNFHARRRLQAGPEPKLQLVAPGGFQQRMTEALQFQSTGSPPPSRCRWLFAGAIAERGALPSMFTLS